MDAQPRPAPPPPSPRSPPPGGPLGPDTGDVLQQIMAITDQSLEEAQARCCAGSAGATLSGGREGGGPRGQGPGSSGCEAEEGAGRQRGVRL